MPSLGKNIHCDYDEFGPIEVYDDGEKRVMTFGGEEEQSSMLKAKPGQLQHEYTRAMMLVMLFRQPRDAIVLGLGGGSLVSCLHHCWPDIKIRAVELRPKVAKVAYKYFQLPLSKRLQVFEADAGEFLDEQPKKTDVLFTDIYSAEGLDQQQIQQWYMQACFDTLKDDGWLVLNCWSEHRAGTDVLDILKEIFSDVRMCSTNTGNWVVLAGKKLDTQSGKQLKDKAKQLSTVLDYSLSACLTRLKHIHPA
jgi:spermidine synthase